MEVMVGGALTGDQEGKAGPGPQQPETERQSAWTPACLPARPPQGTSQTPGSSPSCRATHWLRGRCARSSPPTTGGFSQREGPVLGIPASAQLTWTRTSLLTGLPAFSLAQIQLLLQTAAGVSSLQHRPERVTRAPEGSGSGLPWDRPVPPLGASVLCYLSKALLCPLWLGSGLCPAPACSPRPPSFQSSPRSSVGLALCLWAQTESLLMGRPDHAGREERSQVRGEHRLPGLRGAVSYLSLGRGWQES